MNNLFQENKNSFLFLLGLFFILSIVLFFTFVRPLGKELKKQELAVSSLETEVSVLEVKATKLSEMTIDTSSLEKQLPLNRDLKKLLLSLKDIEQASKSHIDSIRLNYGNQLPTVNFDESDEETEVDHDHLEDTDEDDEITSKVIPMDEKPANLEVISIHMSVDSPDFDHFKRFIKEVEKLERITIISKLDFTQPDQYLGADENIELFDFTIELLTFYYLD